MYSSQTYCDHSSQHRWLFWKSLLSHHAFDGPVKSLIWVAVTFGDKRVDPCPQLSWWLSLAVLNFHYNTQVRGPHLHCGDHWGDPWFRLLYYADDDPHAKWLWIYVRIRCFWGKRRLKRKGETADPLIPFHTQVTCVASFSVSEQRTNEERESKTAQKKAWVQIKTTKALFA